VGMGVQNMHRRYETTVPYRPEMVAILRAAYERGITFFDTAEAYGPWENERILGEAIQPFRNKVRITSKFGWNIDQQTGRRLPGFNSKPDHIKVVVENSLKRFVQTTRRSVPDSPVARSKSYEVEALFAPRSSRDHDTGGLLRRERIARYHLMMPLAPSPAPRADSASLTSPRR
jgi:hypothetical protein